MNKKQNTPKVQPIEVAIILAMVAIAVLFIITALALAYNSTVRAASWNSGNVILVPAVSDNAHSARYMARTIKDDYVLAGSVTIRFADCMADNAEGDLYNTPNPYCVTGEEQAVSNEEQAVKHNPRHADNVTNEQDQTELPVQPVIIDNGGAVADDNNSQSVEPELPAKTDNGNHYGNDKPDNNSKDVNNSHNGEQSYDDHHNEQKGKGKG